MGSDLVDAIDDAAGAIRRADNRGGLGLDVHESLRRALACLDKAKKLANAESERADVATLELRPEVLAFAHLMETKLRENDHKGGWQNDGVSTLLRRLREETDEVLAAIRDTSDKLDPSRVGREAADVANFAMMIADNVGALTEARARPDAPDAAEFAELLQRLDERAKLGSWESHCCEAAAALRKVLGELKQAQRTHALNQTDIYDLTTRLEGACTELRGEVTARLDAEARAEQAERKLAREREAHEETRKRLSATDAALTERIEHWRERAERAEADLAREREAHALEKAERERNWNERNTAREERDAARAEVERLKAAAEPVRWDDVDGLGRIVWRESAKAYGLPTLPYEHEPAAACQAAGAAVASALARSLLTEDTLDAFVGAVIREPDRDLTNLVTTGAGMRAALAHAGANVEAEPELVATDSLVDDVARLMCKNVSDHADEYLNWQSEARAVVRLVAKRWGVRAEPAAAGRPCPDFTGETVEMWARKADDVDSFYGAAFHVVAGAVKRLEDEVRRLGGGVK